MTQMETTVPISPANEPRSLTEAEEAAYWNDRNNIPLRFDALMVVEHPLARKIGGPVLRGVARLTEVVAGASRGISEMVR